MMELHELIGQKVHQLREARQLLQRELAKAGGLPVRTVGRIERGEVDMRISTLRKLAKALGVDVKDLLP